MWTRCGIAWVAARSPGRVAVFKHLTISFTGPICSCPKRMISASISTHDGLAVVCETCKISITVPFDQLRAKYEFDEPYPDEAGDLVVSKMGEG